MKKTQGEMPQSSKVDSRPMVHFGFEECPSGLLPPGYTKPLEPIEDVSCLRVLKHPQSAFFRDQEADKKCEHVAPLLRAFLI